MRNLSIIQLIWFVSLYNQLLGQDCPDNDLTVYTDDTCIAMELIPPYTTTYGSNVTFRCSSRLQNLPSSYYDGFCPVELCISPGNWTDGDLSCAQDECYDNLTPQSYQGKRTCALSGTQCQAWSSQTPHAHSFVSSDFYEGDITLASNYCRDPVGTKGQPWCFTTDPLIVWQFCEIPLCSDLPIDFGDCVDCGTPDYQIAIDHQCTELKSVVAPPTIEGSILKYDCNTLLLKFKSSFDFCPVEECKADGLWSTGKRSCGDNECYSTGSSMWYEGRQICSVTGRPCLRWDSVVHGYVDTSFSESSIALAGSYCRDPDGAKGQPWCYVSESEEEFCGVAVCSDVPLVTPCGETTTIADLTTKGETTTTMADLTTTIVQCVIPPSVSNATFQYSGTNVGDTVTYTCSHGFTVLSGNLVHTCAIDGTWSGILPVCTIITCPEPPAVPNATYYVLGYNVGHTVTYTCNSGYSHTAGDLVRTCTNSGTWDLQSPVCSGTTCPVPPTVQHATYVASGSNVGDTVTYTCDPGFVHTSGSLYATCMTSGTWDLLPPSCSDFVDITGGNHRNRNYVKLQQDLINYTEFHSETTRSNINCAKRCNSRNLCKIYIFDDTLKLCSLYKLFNSGNLACSGINTCYVRLL